jgi:hypothetical protein
VTTMIRLDDEVVATVGATRAYLAPRIEELPAGDLTRLTVEYMCHWALASDEDRSGRAYSDEHALRFARWRLERDGRSGSEEPG